MSTLTPFPDVDPGAITQAGSKYADAARDLQDAASGLRSVAGTASWRSPQARPAWDDAVDSRSADVSGSHEVLSHVADVLRMTGAELARSKQAYDAAAFAILVLYPDPRDAVTSTGGGNALSTLLDPTRTPAPVDQQALALHLAQVKKADDAASDAELLLATCAQELMAVTAGVSFASVPPAPTAVDPTSFAIVPFAPAVGAPSGAIYANGVPVQFTKGKAFESQILRELGISGNGKDFFRPDKDGVYRLPRTKSGTLYRGTFPDSTRAGVLEIKSGTSEITMKSPQIRLQNWVARTLNQPYNLITDSDTEVDPAVLAATRATGGSVYSRVPGTEPIYYDRNTGEYVQLKGGAGADSRQVERTPLSQEEAEKIPAQVRSAVEDRANGLGRPVTGGSGTPPSTPGPSEPYTTEQEYDDAWAKADVSPEGDTPLPGTSLGEPGEVEPVEPVAPIEPVEPIEPIFPFEEIIP